MKDQTYILRKELKALDRKYNKLYQSLAKAKDNSSITLELEKIDIRREKIRNTIANRKR